MTKSSERILSANKLRESLRNALRVSVGGRPGPVHLDVMANIFAAEVDVDEGQLREEVPLFRTAARIQR
jgi:thiamine pyrophosphate-dependent acetolactate synthase large subunit-like protein